MEHTPVVSLGRGLSPLHAEHRPSKKLGRSQQETITSTHITSTTNNYNQPNIHTNIYTLQPSNRATMSHLPQQRRKRNYSSMSSGTTTTTTTTTTSTTNGTIDSTTTTRDEVAVDHRNHIVTVKVTCTTTGCDHHATPSSRGGGDDDESPTDDNNNNSNSNNGNTSPSSYQCTLIPVHHTLFQQDGETTAAIDNNNNHQRYIMLVSTLSPSSPSTAKYSFKVINNDALDDYSISVSVNEQLLGNEEIIVIPKDEVLLDEFYPGGPLSLGNNNNNDNNSSNDDDDDDGDDEKNNENNENNSSSSSSSHSLSSSLSSIATTESVMVVISASSVDSIKKKTARVNKRNARYSVVKGENQTEISIECLTPVLFSERIKAIGYDQGRLHPSEQAILSRRQQRSSLSSSSSSSSVSSSAEKSSSSSSSANSSGGSGGSNSSGRATTTTTRRRISANSRTSIKQQPSRVSPSKTNYGAKESNNGSSTSFSSRRESSSSMDNTSNNSSNNSNSTNGSNHTSESKQMKKLHETVLRPIYDSLTCTEQHLFHNTYYPQLSDKIAFVRDGYLAFWKSIGSVSLLRQHIQPLLTHLPPLDNGSGLPDVMFCTVKRIDYHTYSICNDSATIILRTLELYVDDIVLMHQPQRDTISTRRQNELVGTSFKLDYYDHPTTMANYMILRQLYECSMNFAEHKLKKGMTIQSSFDREFHSGKIMTIGASSSGRSSSSPWECILVRWKDGSESKISAWEIKQIEKQEDLQIPFIEEDLARELQQELDQFCQQEIIQQLPNYLCNSLLPLSLETIRERMENRFYRSTDSFLNDLRCVVSTVSRLAIGSDAHKLLKWFLEEVDLVISNHNYKDGDDYSSDEDDDCNFIEFSFSRFRSTAVSSSAAMVAADAYDDYYSVSRSYAPKHVERKFVPQGTDQMDTDFPLTVE